MSGTGTVLQQFVSGLKSRNEDTRAKAAKDLQHYVTTELREVCNTSTLFTRTSIHILLISQKWMLDFMHKFFLSPDLPLTFLW